MERKLYKVNVSNGIYEKYMYVISDSMDKAADAVDSTWRIMSVELLADEVKSRSNWGGLIITE